jgi:hypothetical protein
LHQRDWLGGKIEIKRNAAAKIDTLNCASNHLLARNQTIAVCSYGSCKLERETIRPIREIMQTLRIGDDRIGMVDALHHHPSRAGRTCNDGRCFVAARAEWTD